MYLLESYSRSSRIYIEKRANFEQCSHPVQSETNRVHHSQRSRPLFFPSRLVSHERRHRSLVSARWTKIGGREKRGSEREKEDVLALMTSIRLRVSNLRMIMNSADINFSLWRFASLRKLGQQTRERYVYRLFIPCARHGTSRSFKTRKNTESKIAIINV